MPVHNLRRTQPMRRMHVDLQFAASELRSVETELASLHLVTCIAAQTSDIQGNPNGDREEGGGSMEEGGGVREEGRGI
eukprot:9470209-Pyramimonas_sp.AAC.1